MTIIAFALATLIALIFWTVGDFVPWIAARVVGTFRRRNHERAVRGDPRAPSVVRRAVKHSLEA
jgi:hypothetical protein